MREMSVSGRSDVYQSSLEYSSQMRVYFSKKPARISKVETKNAKKLLKIPYFLNKTTVNIFLYKLILHGIIIDSTQFSILAFFRRYFIMFFPRCLFPSFYCCIS